MLEEKDGYTFLEIPNWESNPTFPFPSTHEISGYLYRPFQSHDLVVVYIDPLEHNTSIQSTKFRFHNQVDEWSNDEKDQFFKNQDKEDWIFFHTHPIHVYLCFQTVFAFPSLRDISNFFLHGLEDKTSSTKSTKYQELIWTVEGIYHLRLYSPFSWLPSTEEEPIDILRIQQYQNLVNDLANIWKSKETIEFFKRSETRPCDFCWWLQTTFRKLSQKFDLSNEYLACSFLQK